MSSATKRKHVTREVVEEFRLPSKDEKIVRVVAGRGNNLHEVKDQQQNSFLVSMPTKYRKNVWIKRGDFVVVTSISEGDKVKGEISTILYKEQIKYIRAQGGWPAEFDAPVPAAELKDLSLKDRSSGESSEDNEDDQLFQNTNRPVYDTSSDDSDSDAE